MVTETDWAYTGDVSLEYGGLFVNLDNVRHGYADVVEVTDLDSACGAAGMVLIEKGSVCLDFRRVRKALGSCGWYDRKADRRCRRAAMAEAVKSYFGMDTGESEVVQTERGGPMSHDGWRATKVVEHTDLRGYVSAVYLD